MRIPNIYTDSHLKAQENIELDANASQHLAKVLRMKKGYQVRLFNGDGMFYPAELIEVGKKVVVAKTADAIASDTESKVHTHLGQVMSRGDRMDYAVQKATELGVSDITPLFSERCEVKLTAERIEKRKAHWQQVAISAAEQCGRAVVPTIHNPVSLDEWLKTSASEPGIKLVLHHRDTQNLEDIQSPPNRVTLLIGPEGGLSEVEIKQACMQQFISTTFGPRVLRTETAPVTALTLIQWLWGDFR